MKRKIFSKLLMVALVIAAVGSFVSCKDYDDDINRLEDQIKLKAASDQLATLQSTLEGKISAAQSAAEAAAKTAATNADAALKADLEKAIAEAKKAGTDAGTEAGKAITAANKAQETADGAAAAAKKADEDAKAALADALKTIEETYQTKAEASAAAAEAAEALAAVKATAEAAFTKAEAEELKAEVEGLKEELESSIDEKIAEAIKELDNATASVDAIWSAITSIEFVVGVNNVWNNINFLNFQYGKEKDNVFGNATERYAYKAADKSKTYVAGDSIKAENVYLVRVSPVTADLAAAGVKLINSKGENLNDYANIAVEKYNDLLTRAGETGLWKLTVTLKENIKIEDLQKATHSIIKGGVTTSAAVYAFAANNTADASADRFAVTAYNLKPLTNKYQPTDALDFNVNGVAVGNIHNRWAAGNIVLAEDETIGRGEDYYELTWVANAAKGVTVPATQMIEKGGSDSKTANYGPDANDRRQTKETLSVKVGEPIIVDFNAADYLFVDRYYVLYDKHNAIESAPSEWNSWNEYKVSGLGEMKKSTERLVITIEDEKANGDILGFRLYAVNFDGTLVDPDGKAFYVQVGKAESLDEVVVGAATFNANETSATFTAAGYTTAQLITNKKNSVIFPVDFSNLGYDDNITLAAARFPNTATVAANTTTAKANIDVDIVYLTSDKLTNLGAVPYANNVNDVTHVLLTVENVEDVVNGQTIATTPQTLVNPDDHDKKLYSIVFQLKKGALNATNAWDGHMPAWKSGWAPASGTTVTLYPGIETPGLWSSDQSAANLTVDLTQYTNDLLFGGIPAKVTVKKNGTTLAAAAAATYYAPATGIFTIPAAEIGKDARAAGIFNAYQLTLEANSGEAISLAGVDKAPTAVSSKIFDYTLQFADIWDYQTYSIEKYGYEDGAIGATATGVANKESDKLMMRYPAAAGQFNIFPAWVDATTAGGKYTAVAKIDYTQGNTAWVAASDYAELDGATGGLALLGVGSNSALSSFTGIDVLNGGFDFANYFSFGQIGTDDAPVVITAATGAINEYVRYFDGNQINANVIAFEKVPTATATLPASTVEMIFQFTATDFIGHKHTIQVPFTLAQ